MNDTTTATVRTGWNLTLFSAVVALVSKLTGWTLTVEDLLPFTPLVGIIGGVFYRFSRVLSEKVSWLGYVLFGSPRTPTNYEKPQE